MTVFICKVIWWGCLFGFWLVVGVYAQRRLGRGADEFKYVWDMPCPDCHQTVRVYECGGTMIMVCPNCGGYLVNKYRSIFFRTLKERLRRTLDNERDAGA